MFNRTRKMFEKLGDRITKQGVFLGDCINVLGERHDAALADHEKRIAEMEALGLGATFAKWVAEDKQMAERSGALESRLAAIEARLPELTGDAPGLPSKVAELSVKIQQQAQLLAGFSGGLRVVLTQHDTMMRDLCEHGKRLETHGLTLRTLPDTTGPMLKFFHERIADLRIDMDQLIAATRCHRVEHPAVAAVPAKPAYTVIEKIK